MVARLSIADSSDESTPLSMAAETPDAITPATPRRALTEATSSAPRRALTLDDVLSGETSSPLPRRGLAVDAVRDGLVHLPRHAAPLAERSPNPAPTRGGHSRQRLTTLVVAPALALAGVATAAFALPNHSATTDAALTAVPAATSVAPTVSSTNRSSADTARKAGSIALGTRVAPKVTAQQLKATTASTTKAPVPKATTTKTTTSKATTTAAKATTKATSRTTATKTATTAKTTTTPKAVVSNVANLGVGACPIGGSASKTCNQAIAYMVKQMNSGANWHNQCLELVDAAYGGGLNRATSAIGAAYVVEARGGMYHTTDFNSIPRGAVLWFKSTPGHGSQMGHAAIAIGGGMSISSDAPVNNGRVGVVPISFFITNWHKTLYGYSAG